MSRQSRWFRASVLSVVTVLAWCSPHVASAWHGRWHHGFWGAGIRPWCGPVYGPACYGGWSGWNGWNGWSGWNGWYGVGQCFSSDSVYVAGPYGGFFSGAVSNCVIGPRWCGPVYVGRWRRHGWGGVTYGPWGCGPVFAAPVGPVFGPVVGVPFIGMSATPPQAPREAAPLVAPPAPQIAARRSAPPVIVRASNGDARLRAASLVAVGDRHLRAAVQAPAKLSAALDAYNRAATIAPDQPDTFLRQAIVLTALNRADAAAKAVDRAVAIDGRLGDDATAALAARDRLPPDPVFGERPDQGPTTFTARTTSLLARIFRGEPGGNGAAAPAGANWIATRWSEQWQGQVNAVAAR